MPKKIDPELKARAVRLVLEHRAEYPTTTAAVAAVAKQAGVGKESLRRWVAQADIDAGDRPGVTSVEVDGFIDALRAEGHAVESICRVLREQDCQIAARTYRAWKNSHRRVAPARSVTQRSSTRSGTWPGPPMSAPDCAS